jgi:RNA polymerase sigma factor (TIGR02999 family)
VIPKCVLDSARSNFTVIGMNPGPDGSSNRSPSLPATAGELLPLVYEELRRHAALRMAEQKPGQTLQATALVHEAWIRLHGDQGGHWNDRAHFFRAAAEAMRRILIDSARSKGRQKRDGGQRIDFSSLNLAADSDPEALLILHEALDNLATVDPEKAELVKLRFFTGLMIEEAADVLGLSQATAKRAWSFARAWLFREIKRLQAGP